VSTQPSQGCGSDSAPEQGAAEGGAHQKVGAVAPQSVPLCMLSLQSGASTLGASKEVRQ